MDPLIQKWRPMLNECRGQIFTWTGDEFAWVVEAATKANLAIEVGIYMGWSSVALMRANPNLSVIGVDNFHVDGTEFVARKNLRQYLDSGRYNIIKSRTRDAGVHLSAFRGSVELAFIDGDHDYDSVAIDIKTIWPLMRMGATMYGHDYVAENKDDPVARAVRDLLPEHFSPCRLLWAATKTREL